MCAVVTVGAVVGPTCGACAARARRWPTAYRRIPKRCAPKSWGLLCTKIINRAIFACFAPRKQVRVCKFHSFSGIFCFLLYTRAQKRASPTPSLGEWHRKWANTGRQSGGGGSILNAFLHMIHKNNCIMRPTRRFLLHAESAKGLRFAFPGANRHTKTAKPPTDTRGVGRRFGRCLIGIGTLFRHIAVRDSAIGHEVQGGLRLSGRCGQ